MLNLHRILINHFANNVNKDMDTIIQFKENTSDDNLNEEESFTEIKPTETINNIKINSFRPITFDEYIGQEKAKNILKSYIKAVKERKIILPHVLIHGQAGCGKTSLAKIIANELKVNFIETITSTLQDHENLYYKIEETKNGILFLDELHSIERNIAESIYSAMEDFKLEGVPISSFTLIGATTEYGELLKTRKPFVDRFKINIELEDYTNEEIKLLIKQYKEKCFDNDKILDEVYTTISTNCRLTPRIAVRLLETAIYMNGDINKVLKSFSIIKDGYTTKDLKTLKYISMNEKGVGLQGVASYLETSTENYVQEIEPYLLKNHLISRTARGRKISESGKQKIIELEKEIL